MLAQPVVEHLDIVKHYAAGLVRIAEQFIVREFVFQPAEGALDDSDVIEHVETESECLTGEAKSALRKQGQSTLFLRGKERLLLRGRADLCASASAIELSFDSARNRNALLTEAEGITNSGDVVGIWIYVGRNGHGFIATPSPSN